MLKREKIFEFVKSQYNVVPDYPWEKFSNYAALRHQDNHKWFALVMDITSDKLGLETEEHIDVINLKIRKDLIDLLIEEEKGIYPAYHMDKSNWITINLKEKDNMDEIKDFIAESYRLTA